VKCLSVLDALARLRSAPELAKDAAEYRLVALAILQDAWGNVRAYYGYLAGKSIELAENEAVKIDLPRLVLLVAEVKEKARRSADITALEDLYQKATRSGDLHLLKAWHSVGPVLARELSPEGGEALAERIEQDITCLWGADDRDHLNAEIKVLAERAFQLQDVTKQAHDFYKDDGGSDFLGLLRGIEIERVDGQGLKLIIKD
jgi:hypothetical protein